jgi:nitrogen fixation-related uncharacterized protein
MLLERRFVLAVVIVIVILLVIAVLDAGSNGDYDDEYE